MAVPLFREVTLYFCREEEIDPPIVRRVDSTMRRANDEPLDSLFGDSTDKPVERRRNPLCRSAEEAPWFDEDPGILMPQIRRKRTQERESVTAKFCYLRELFRDHGSAWAAHQDDTFLTRSENSRGDVIVAPQQLRVIPSRSRISARTAQAVHS